MVEIRIKNLR